MRRRAASGNKHARDGTPSACLGVLTRCCRVIIPHPSISTPRQTQTQASPPQVYPWPSIRQTTCPGAAEGGPVGLRRCSGRLHPLNHQGAGGPRRPPHSTTPIQSTSARIGAARIPPTPLSLSILTYPHAVNNPQHPSCLSSLAPICRAPSTWTLSAHVPLCRQPLGERHALLSLSLSCPAIAAQPNRGRNNALPPSKYVICMHQPA